MIVVDTSALVAVITNEPAGQGCRSVLETETRIMMSAATVTEAVIVATRRDILDEMNLIIESSVNQIVELTSDRARAAGAAYSRWGKGIHPAGLNFGDCFAYALAKEFDCALLYVGNDFARTDIASAIPPIKT
jgi:ribonuclease VapC